MSECCRANRPSNTLFAFHEIDSDSSTAVALEAIRFCACDVLQGEAILAIVSWVQQESGRWSEDEFFFAISASHANRKNEPVKFQPHKLNEMVQILNVNKMVLGILFHLALIIFSNGE